MATSVPRITISEDTIPFDHRRSSVSASFAPSTDPSRRLLDALRHHDLFASIPTSSLIHITKFFHFVHFRRGDVVTRWGELGDAMFWIVAGRVKVVDEGQEARLAEVGQGMFFGECAVSLEGVRREATVTVISEQALLASLTREELCRALSMMPGLLESLQEHALSLYETALIGRHEFGTKEECRLSELRRPFPSMNSLVSCKSGSSRSGWRRECMGEMHWCMSSMERAC